MARLNILHISDLHFGEIEEEGKHHSTHFFTREERPDPEQLAELLIDAYAHQPPQLVIASGDIGWSGVEPDYEPAGVFFSLLRDKWTVPFVIVPGNHDVDRKSTCDSQRQEAFLKFLRTVFSRDQGDATTSEFDQLHPFHRDKPNRDNLLTIQSVKDGENGPVIAVVVGMNSAAGLADHSTPVRVDPEALQRVERQLKQLAIPEDALKIFVIHHHLLPFAEASRDWTSDTRRAAEGKADPELVANSAKLQSWLVQHRFHLVLHGHKHTSHIREDVLRHEADETGARLLIVGAGSTGVRKKSRSHGEHLSYNYLMATRFSNARWQIRVEVKKILDTTITPEVRSLYEYTSIAGGDPQKERLLPIFRAERMDDCHLAITSDTRGSGLLYNFLSVVEDATYVHPPTARNGDGEASRDLIEQGFKVLHPEYEPTREWSDLASVDGPLQQAQLSYRFEHGSRLFHGPDNRLRSSAEEVMRTSPLGRAIAELNGADSTSKAYVSLYRSDIDVLSERPLPGLMSLHFIVRDGKLDLTATFRKLELSFWWCLNMYELGKLLRWVCGKVRKQPGRLTFFASLAEWKQKPEPPLEAELDRIPIAKLLPIVLGEDKDALKRLIREKANFINENSLESSGLERLGQLLEGASRHGGDKYGLSEFQEKIENAKESVIEAKRVGPHDRDRHIRAAVSALEAALQI